jgi:2-keto-3-deoxy-L-rhamnonate aldolase RhmA
MWVTIPWPPLLSIMGSRGIDAALIDLEHSSITSAEVERLITAAEASGVCPLVRMRSTDPQDASMLLDMGAQGLIFPRISNRLMAEEAVRCSRYPPAGSRGWAGGHSHYDFWAGAGSRDNKTVLSDAYARAAEEYVLTAVLVETVDGVQNIDEILDVRGIDVVLFGKGDYSVEVGFSTELVNQASSKVAAAARSRGIGMGIPLGDISADRIYDGCFVHLGDDAVVLADCVAGMVKAAADRLASIRTAGGTGNQ